jgi:hypothetical protein
LTKTRQQISSSVDPSLWSEIKKISGKTAIPSAKLLDEGMKRIIEEYQKNKRVEIRVGKEVEKK